MRNFFTILLLSFTLLSIAQAPVIEGTYLPVRGTSVKEVWDTTNNSLSIPTPSINQVWDYSNQFTHVVNTYTIQTFDAATTPYNQYFPTATHATYLRTPFNNPSDSLYSFLIIDQVGVHNIGGFNIKKAYDSLVVINPGELLLPSTCTYPMTMHDTSKYVGYAKNVSGFKVKTKGKKYKLMSGYGYGTLKLPGHTYNNVLLAREDVITIDSIYVDFSGTGNYSFFTVQTNSLIAYAFIRNNTFGSSYLMHITANAANTMTDFGWYALPVDFGSISGTVFTSTTQVAPVVKGEAYLYRENSNFAKNDILAKDSLDSNGNYQFDSIPYGEYRIAIRADTSVYHRALITYYGDTTNWLDAKAIITNSLSSATGNNIHLQYHAPPVGAGIIGGTIGSNSSIMKTTGLPIPGVGIIIKKNPGGGAARGAITDANGSFTLSALDNGNYDMFVDIPGLHMAGTYNFSISGGTVVNWLDFTVGTHSIHPNAIATVINEPINNNHSTTDFISAYPNPYAAYTTILVNLKEKSDMLLEVYNMLGEKIQVLDKGLKQAGSYNYMFGAKNLNYASGMYLIKLSSGDKTKVLKVIEQ